MSNLRKIVTRDEMLAYINGIVLEGLTKKGSYQKYVNDTLSQPQQAVIALEKKPEFQELYRVIMEDDAMQLAAKAKKVQLDYVKLIEKNIGTAARILDDVADKEITDRAIAVRLVNETVGAMGVVTGTSSPNAPGKLDKGSVVL